MHLYLFGGTGPGNFSTQRDLIFSIIKNKNPKQLLLVPFASGRDSYVSLSKKQLTSTFPSIELLHADNENHIERAAKPLIFVLGGRDHKGLFQSIVSNKRLESIIRNCENYIGESAGAMIAGTLQRASSELPESPLMKGLGLLPDTIIEPHYTERNRHTLLREEMKIGRVKYGIGIDEASGIHIDLSNYRHTWEKIGEGEVSLIH